MDTIDWRLAQRVGELLAGSPSYEELPTDSVSTLSKDFAARVSAYAELQAPGELPSFEVIDRPRWIEANLASMRPLLEGVTPRLGHDLGALSSVVDSASSFLLGVQVGAIAGMLSQRVLGQYDVALLDAERQPRLLLVAPNLDKAANDLNVDPQQLIAWVAIHEITHALQFGGAPWLREHLAGILTQLIESLQVSASMGELLEMIRAQDLRGLTERVRRGELLRISLGEERWALVENMQAAMTLIEGHAEHVMDAIGAEVLPELEQLRTAMSRRRSERGLPWRVLERLLGLELKLRQYEQGRQFCEAVVKDAGPSTLALAWREPANLPSTQELEDPRSWLERVA